MLTINLPELHLRGAACGQFPYPVYTRVSICLTSSHFQWERLRGAGDGSDKQEHEAVLDLHPRQNGSDATAL